MVRPGEPFVVELCDQSHVLQFSRGETRHVRIQYYSVGVDVVLVVADEFPYVMERRRISQKLPDIAVHRVQAQIPHAVEHLHREHVDLRCVLLVETAASGERHHRGSPEVELLPAFSQKIVELHPFPQPAVADEYLVYLEKVHKLLCYRSSSDDYIRPSGVHPGHAAALDFVHGAKVLHQLRKLFFRHERSVAVPAGRTHFGQVYHGARGPHRPVESDLPESVGRIICHLVHRTEYLFVVGTGHRPALFYTQPVGETHRPGHEAVQEYHLAAFAEVYLGASSS